MLLERNGAPLTLSELAAAEGRVRIYRNVSVIDGTGAPRYVADVAIERSRIVAIQPAGETHPLLQDIPEGAVIVDGHGRVLAPGFIDMHAHSDLAVLRGADHDAKILQGVTTEVIGQDGLGYAPCDADAAAHIAAQIAGWNGPTEPVARSMDAYLAEIDRATVANTAVLVPQGNLRMMVVGHDDRAATQEEIAQMCELLGDALDAGAVGMSSGLTYVPGMYASTAELERLCLVVAERGGFWAPHTRSYGGGALDAYREVLDIGRRTGCPIHLTHATMNFASNRGRAAELLALVDEALTDGVDVTLDSYPYLPGATTLAALLPSSFAAGGDPIGALRALDAEGREALRVLMEEEGCDGFHGEKADWSAIQISGVSSESLAHLVGRRIDEIAADEGRRAIDVVVDTLITDSGATGILMHVGDEENVRAIMRHPRHAGGSDGILIGALPHPRGFGSFARYLGVYVRELGVLGLEEAVRHLSAVPARRLGLDRGDAPRGVVREGATADLVLFDPDTVIDRATFQEPRHAPHGLIDVLVDGVPVVENSRVTGEEPGRALRATPPAHRATVPFIEGRVDIAPRRERHTLPVVTSVAEDAASDPVRRLPEQGEEAFRVEISESGITLWGATRTGLFRAETVLDQLTGADGRVPMGVWEGEPGLRWRGIMLDVARHFRPVDEVLALIDVLALHHATVLHLHLTDDQGWRYEVPGWPRLIDVGARRLRSQRGHGPQAPVVDGVHEGSYSTDDLRRIIAYAEQRHILVVPEVELPGHVQAALAAYPELGNADATELPTEPWPRYGLNPHTLNLDEVALGFCRDAIDALIDIFPSPWIGIGGDEVPFAEWADSPRAMERAREHGINEAREIQPWITRTLVAHVADRGRRAYAWDEVLAGDPGTAVDIAAWRGHVAAEQALARGFGVVLCPDLTTYLDYRQSDSMDEPIPVGPPQSVRDVWRFSPGENAGRILGAQANVWSEHLDSKERVDFALFPRASALLERFWAAGEPGDVEDFERRLLRHLERLAERGVRYRPSDGPTPEQRRPGILASPITRVEREAVVAGLVEHLLPHATM